MLVALGVLACCAAGCDAGDDPTSRGGPCRRTLVVVAHPDDDLFFTNPRVADTVQHGCRVTAA